MQQNTIGIRHQNFMLAVRRELGWPGFRPCNDAIAFCSGRKMDIEVGSEMARIAQTLRKDAVYTGWANMAARTASAVNLPMLTPDSKAAGFGRIS